MVLGNIAILVASGIVGSVLTRDENIPGLGDVLSGASKFMKKQGKDGADAKSGSDQNAQLLSQVNQIRQDLQNIKSNSSLTVVTSAAKSGPGAFTITAVVIAGVVGYAYIKWKGWKLSDMMFVTKRGLSDACNVVGSQLDQVSDTVAVTKRHLAGRINRVDISLDETQQIIEGTRDEVTIIHGDLSAFQEDLQSVNLVVRTLESKMGRLESSQDQTIDGIHHLCEFTRKMESGQNGNVRQVSSSIPAAIGSSSDRIVRATCLPRSTTRLALEAVSPVDESPRAESSQVSPVAESPRAETWKEQQGLASLTSSISSKGSSEPLHGASSSSKASMNRANPNLSRFGGLRLPGLSFLCSAASS